MSTNWLKVIPSDPGWVPTASREEALLDVLRELAPGAEAVRAVTSDAIEFVDAGANLRSIRCNACSAELDLEWWQAQMTRSHATGFVDLQIVTDCCGSATSLNDLVYDWPSGFARWVAEAEHPDRRGLTLEEIDEVRTALGHDFREIWTHV